MALPQQQGAEEIAKYRNGIYEAQKASMDLDSHDTEARLAQTIKDLQARVEEQQDALDQLRSRMNGNDIDSAYASSDPRKKLLQLHAVSLTYQRLKSTAPHLPDPGSLLPALLLARTLQKNSQGTRDAAIEAQSQLTSNEASIRREEASLRDAKLLSHHLEDRIDRLRTQHGDHSQKSPAQLAREYIAAKRARKESFEIESKDLGMAMNDFINDYLSAMVAAEELGGPVVGEMLDIEDDVLASGFTKQGRAKTTKKKIPDKTRQRRIDQIWGSAAAAEEEQERPTEAESADAALRQLLEDLFATLVGPGAGKAYHEVKRDSAAVRFLVRAKVAQYHPRDARKVRLIDFGGELDDQGWA